MTRPAEVILRELVHFFCVEDRGERGPHATLAAVYKPTRVHNWCFAWARNSYDEAALAHLVSLLNESRELFNMELLEVHPRAVSVLCQDDTQVGVVIKS